MYKIGEFSRITSLTVKTLRYYDEEHILSPSCRNEENSYRYYDEDDFRKARLVALLRDLDFSITEMKDVLAGCEGPEDLPYYLEEKKSMLERRIAGEKELIARLNLYIQSGHREENEMPYKIETREIPPVLVATVRYRGKYGDVGIYYGKIYKELKGNGAGVPFSCYYDAEFSENADIEVCVPTAKEVSRNGITTRRLPAIKAICTTHTGSYGKLNLAYKALLDYADEHGLKCLTPSREAYIKGPGMIFKGNENKYITEILVPYEEV